MFITLTEHCIKQIQARGEKNRKGAVIFGRTVFRKIMRGDYKGREIRIRYERNGKYKITDGVHQFIFAKPFKIELILITYVKRERPLPKTLCRGWKKYTRRGI